MKSEQDSALKDQFLTWFDANSNSMDVLSSPNRLRKRVLSS